MTIPPVRIVEDASSRLSTASRAGEGKSAPAAIGADLEAMRAAVANSAETLRRVLPGQLGTFLDETTGLLDRLACRIAVIGQVKAGKSSFINAFVRQPALLPTHVNPWTTAVTHLHFGRRDAPRDTAAKFTFFEHDEWSSLVSGGGYIRDLTQRFVPGFEVDLLKQHVESMRRRSEERLGSKLGELLGTSHTFPEFSTQQLSHYVCAGAFGAQGVTDEQTGIYSDVIKQADLYFESPTFSFPTVVIDTPGTNDPFLVRDEITRRTLDTADIHIAVLTARQPLSTADVALLRILHGLNKERVVIFINRIDELANVARDTSEIVDDVRKRLREVFPQSDMRVVAGSALWAQTALNGSANDVRRFLGLKAQAYAAQLGLQVASGSDGASVDEAGSAANVLLQCSGVPELCEAVAKVAPRSHAGHVLMQVAASLKELAQVGQPVLRRELEDLESEGEKAGDVEEQLRQVDVEVRDNERTTLALHCLQVDMQARTDQMIKDQHTRIVDTLQDTVDAFAARECEALGVAMSSPSRRRTWTSRPTGLRQVLETTFVKCFREAEQNFNELEQFITPRLREIAKSLHPSPKAASATLPAVPAELPPLGALGRTIALDLADPWWKRWWSRPRAREELAVELDRLIRQEFYPIIDMLAHSARTRLIEKQTLLLQNTTMLTLGVIEVLQELSEAKLQRVRALKGDKQPGATGASPFEREERIATIRSSIDTVGEISERLEELEARWRLHLN
jgi:hypothetical protein